MTVLTVAHAYHSNIADGGDNTLVQPSNWNANHSLTIAGTSGGIPYFDTASSLASSGALTANGLVLGGGAGAAPTSMTGTSGGVPYFNATTTVTSSAALTASALVLGGGAGAAPSTPVGLGTTTTVLHGNAAGNPSFAAVSLTADVSGVLPLANGGTGSGSSSLGSSGNVLFNNSGAIAGMSGTTWDNTNLALTIAGATVTTSNPILNLSQTWNASGVTFTALKLNVTNTASAAASLLMDLQVASASQFNVDKAGNVNVPNSTWTLTANAAQTLDYGATHLNSWNFTGTVYLGSNSVRVNAGAGTLEVFSGGAIGFDSGSITTSLDTQLFRDAAGILAQRNSTNAQTLRVYNTFTDASNYERGVFDWTTTANVLTIGTQASGTGTLRAIAFVGADFVHGASVATNATDGFVYIPSCAGTPTGTPTTFTGTVPMVYDRTNNKFYIYNSGWKGGTNPGAFT